MRNTLGRLIIWIAEMLDRSLLTVPDIDEHRASARVRHLS